MVKTSQIILLIISLTFIQSCNENKTSKNRFYKKEGDMYYVVLNRSNRLYSTNKHRWFFKPIYGEIGLRKELLVDKVYNSKNLIVVYSSLTNVDHRMSEAWFVFELNHEKQIFFRSEKKFKNYISTVFDEDVKLLGVNEFIERARHSEKQK